MKAQAQVKAVNFSNSIALPRPAIAALVLAGAASMFGGVGAAFADGPKPGNPTSPLVTRNVSATPLMSTGSRVTLPSNTLHLTRVQTGATGQGATASQCAAKERIINGLYEAAAESASEGTLAGKTAASDLTKQASDEIDAALDAGCWVIS